MNGIIKFIRAHSSVMICILGIITGYTVLGFFGITCPIKFITGISCPGCGMTRACISALRLDFSAAFFYHPLWILMIPTVIFLIVFYKRKMNICKNVLIICLALLFVAVYFIRIFSGSDIVTFAPRDGIFFRLYYMTFR